MNLTSVSKWFKKAIVYVGGFVIFYYILILVIIPGLKTTWELIIPEKNPPTLSYGMLPSLAFTTKPVSGVQAYELNTTTGKLPTNLPTKAKVYKFKPLGFSYNAGKSAQDNAAYFGFTDGDLITDLKGKTYKWRSLKTGGILEINIDTKELLMSTTLLNKGATYKVGTLSDSAAVSETTNMLESIGRMDEMYLAGTNTVYKGKYVGNKLVETEDRNDAQIYRIDFFRRIENYDVVGPDPTVSLLHVYMGEEDVAGTPTSRVKVTPATFPIMELHYNEIDSNSTATYPLVPITQAWEAVKQGQGIIANVTPKGANPFVEYETTLVQNVLINEISIAYYETPEAQDYLQPIYVFQGNYKTQGTAGGDITIYFPAVAGEYIKAVTQ